MNQPAVNQPPVNQPTVNQPTEEQSIGESLWWVLPGKLGGVRKPTDSELPELQALGVGAIVSVMDDPSNLDCYAKAGIPHLWLPTTGGTPPTREQIIELSDFIDQHHNQPQELNRGVVVHCTSGRRRTGTFLASYLVHTGKTFEEALQIVQAANPAVELRDAQIAFIKELAQSQHHHPIPPQEPPHDLDK